MNPTGEERLVAATPAVAGSTSLPLRSRRGLRQYVALAVVGLLSIGVISNLAAPQPPRVGGIDPTAAPGARAEVSAAATTRPTSVSASAASAAPPSIGELHPTGPTQVGRVTRIVDGDTIHVTISGKDYALRYIGMNTPEVDASDPAVREMATAATAANAALVAGKSVILERDVSETDRYHRLLRNVWLDDGGSYRLVNLELVRLGVAQVSTYPPDVRYVDLLTAAQAVARDAEVGLWAPAAARSPTTAPEAVAVADVLRVAADAPTRIGGHVGSYAWSTVSFENARMTVRWKADSTTAEPCQVGWRLDIEDGSEISSTIRVKAEQSVTGNRRYDTLFTTAALRVTSTCAIWNMSLQGYQPATQGIVSGGGAGCDPSYPGVCIPPYPPDLDCSDITERRFVVRGSDPHGFDLDNDGIGCEG